MTVTTADDKLCKLIEPNVSVSSERFKALAEMSDAGLFTGITLMPVLPFIENSEANIINIVKTAHECGVRAIYPAFGMTLRQNQRDYYFKQIDNLFPEYNLSEKYKRYYGDRYSCTVPNVKKLWGIFTSECDKYGILYNMRDIISAYKMGYGDSQMSFFD